MLRMYTALGTRSKLLFSLTAILLVYLVLGRSMTGSGLEAFVTDSLDREARYEALWQHEEMISRKTLKVYTDRHSEQSLRFVRFQHLPHTGHSNRMQEMNLVSEVAMRSGRSWVWGVGRSPEDDSGNRRDLPLSATIAWHLQAALDQASRDKSAPPAVSNQHFEHLCAGEIHEISLDKVEGIPQDPRGRLNFATQWLRNSSERCVHVNYGVFTWEHMGTPEFSATLWPQVLSYYSHQNWLTSPLVEGAAKRRLREILPFSSRFFPSRVWRKYALLGYKPGTLAAPLHTRLAVMHIRRGDFLRHCSDVLSQFSSTYASYCQVPPIAQMPRPPDGSTEEERWRIYEPHCLPSHDIIIQRIKDVVKQHNIDTIYFATNAEPSWMAELQTTIESTKGLGLRRSVFSASIDYDEADFDVTGQIDAEIARQAGVFVGNGFSSLSAQIVMLRFRDGVPADRTQMW